MGTSYDISRITTGWGYDPRQLTMRMVRGDDGLEKIQIRLPLGMLQCELDGRPDGKRPFGRESLIDYCVTQKEEWVKQHGSTENFKVRADVCENLKVEGAMYYHRYLSLFVHEDYERVMRDTAKHLQIIRFLRDYAEPKFDQSWIPPTEPYIVTMHARAESRMAIRSQKFNIAFRVAQKAIRTIEEMNLVSGIDNESSTELAILNDLKEVIFNAAPDTFPPKLYGKLAKALEMDDREEAERIRRQLKEMGAAPSIDE